MLEKEVVLKEAQRQLEKLQSQLQSQREGGAQLAVVLNEYKTQIKAINRKIMSTLAQLSVNQTTAMKLGQEKQQKVHTPHHTDKSDAHDKCA